MMKNKDYKKIARELYIILRKIIASDEDYWMVSGDEINEAKDLLKKYNRILEA